MWPRADLGRGGRYRLGRRVQRGVPRIRPGGIRGALVTVLPLRATAGELWMSEPWMLVEKHAAESPELYQVAKRLQLDPEVCFSRWFRLWSWIDDRFPDGKMPGVSFSEVGWIRPAEDGLEVPEFSQRWGVLAAEAYLARHERYLARERTRRWREKQRSLRGSSDAASSQTSRIGTDRAADSPSAEEVSAGTDRAADSLPRASERIARASPERHRSVTPASHERHASVTPASPERHQCDAARADLGSYWAFAISG